MLLMAACFFIVFSFVSCTEAEPMTLCEISLEKDEASRSIERQYTYSDTVLYYKATSSDAKAYGKTTTGYYEKVPSKLTLSQGDWHFEVVGITTSDYNNLSDKARIADAGITSVKALAGSTDAKVTLATTTIQVPLSYNGIETSAKGIVDLLYTAYLPKGYNSMAFDIVYENVGTNTLTHTNTSTTPAAVGENGQKYQETYSLDQGEYIAFVNVRFYSEFTSPLKFTESLGFLARNGITTRIEGETPSDIPGIETDNKEDDNYVFFPDPQNPDKQKNEVVTVGGTADDENKGNISNFTSETIQDETTYVLVGNSSNQVSLGHASDDGSANNQDNRMVTPDPGTSFGVDLAGNDVLIAVSNGTFNGENSTIIELDQDVTMTVINTDDETATYGLFKSGTGNFLQAYRVDPDMILNGGTFNAGTSKSNGGIRIEGPQKDNKKSVLGAGITNYVRAGVFNIKDAGGTINLSGDVDVVACQVITTTIVEVTNSPRSSLSASTTEINVNLSGTSRFTCVGDSDDAAMGMNILGNSKGGSIDVHLSDSSYISATGGKANSNYGIYIENFTGDITITIDDNAYITTNGVPIKLNNCTGKISISLASTSSLMTTTSGKNLIEVSGASSYELTVGAKKRTVSGNRANLNLT